MKPLLSTARVSMLLPLLALLLVVPTTLYAQALDLIFANGDVNRVCLNDGMSPPSFTCSNVSGDTNDSRGVAVADVGARPDLSTSMKAVDDASGDTQAQPGEVLTYEITVTNTGDAISTSVVITDAAPANTSFVEGSAMIASQMGATSVVIDQGDEAGETTLRVTLAALAITTGEVVVSFQVTVDKPVPAGTTTLDNNAQVEADDIPSFDTNTASIPVDAEPDMALTKDDGGVTVMPGEVITYTLTYTNGGDEGATGVKITETVPDNTTFTGSG